MMNLRLLFVLIFGAVALVAAGCGAGAPTEQAAPTGTPATTAAETKAEGATNEEVSATANPAVNAAVAALEAAGWKLTAENGMTPLAEGATQLGFYAVTAPGGDQLQIQFLDSGGHAADELAAIQQQDTTFMGVRVGNALVWAAPNGHTPLPKIDLDSLQSLLPS